MRRTALFLIGFLALAGLIGYAVTSGRLGGSTGGGEAGATTGVERFDAATGTTGAPREAALAPASGGGGGAAEPDTISGTQLASLPEIGPSVIRSATITIQVGKDGFEQAFDTASLVAGRYGGYVQSSSMAGTKVRSGDLVLRVPADRFDQAISDLRGLGTVQDQSMSGEDVSSQFVDLEARLRTWQAQEAVLLRLMDQATTIEATIRVQGELQDVQLRIEQLKGQLNLLQDQTDFATIQVSLHEPGAPTVVRTEVSTRPSLAEAWGKALDGFLGVCYAVVVGLGYLIPIALLGALAWLGFRRLRAPRPTSPAA